MTDILDARNLIQQEETRTRAPVSETLLNRVGASNNFIVNRQYKSLDFKFLGPFRSLFGGEDGTRGTIVNSEIIGVTGYIRVTGSSGTTTVDCHLIRAGADLGSIFSTPLSISSAASDGISFYTNTVFASSQGGTGVTLPVISVSNINEGDSLRVDLDSNAVGAFDISFNIHYRAR